MTRSEMRVPARPIPDAPSLEFERKAAKALLRDLRSAQPEALTRATAVEPRFVAEARGSFKLSDAQRIIAREYGFRSWTRMVRWFAMMQQEAPQHPMTAREHRGLAPPDMLERLARSMMTEHRARGREAAYTLARYVPRLYGEPLADVFADEIALEDAQFAIACREGFRSWSALLAAATAQHERARRDPWHVDASSDALHALDDADVERLRLLLAQHPEWSTNVDGVHQLNTLLDVAVRGGSWLRRDLPHDSVVDALLEAGAEPHPALERALEGGMYMRTEHVRWLLARGANPNAFASGGLPMLEAAILRWWNGEAVDELAARFTPRDALWIHAGLGNVDGVKRGLDARGKPLRRAAEDRPPFHQAGGVRYPQHPDPDDMELLHEIFWVATLNGRGEVIEHLARCGFDVDTLRWEMPMLAVAVGNGWLNAAEALIAAGANLDLRGSTNGSAREMARERWLDHPSPEYRPIVELVGLDPDALLAERAQATPVPATLSHRLDEVFQLASTDAQRCGRTEVDEESLFIGLLRTRHSSCVQRVRWARGIDVRRFVDMFGDRLTQPLDEASGSASDSLLPLSRDAQTTVDSAVADCTARYRAVVGDDSVLHALISTDDRRVSRLLASCGADVTHLRRELNRQR